MTIKKGGSTPFFDPIFDNFDDSKKTVDENQKSFSLNIIEEVFKKVEKICILLGHDIFNEVEAAYFLRLSDPETTGREIVRNYALKSRKLSFSKIGRNGLTFSREDLEKFVQSQKAESFQVFND